MAKNNSFKEAALLGAAEKADSITSLEGYGILKPPSPV
jgi:hypothetical protein